MHYRVVALIERVRRDHYGLSESVVLSYSQIAKSDTLLAALEVVKLAKEAAVGQKEKS